MSFVPAGFEPPRALDTRHVRLRPLDVEHNASDHAAWSASIEHIRATPGFEGSDWPRPMTPAENERDLARHAADFRSGRGFTYTVLAPDRDEVIGCVYIYPDDDGRPSVRSWVRADRAELDAVLVEVVTRWLAEVWPFDAVRYR